MYDYDVIYVMVYNITGYRFIGFKQNSGFNLFEKNKTISKSLDVMIELTYVT